MHLNYKYVIANINITLYPTSYLRLSRLIFHWLQVVRRSGPGVRGATGGRVCHPWTAVRNRGWGFRHTAVQAWMFVQLWRHLPHRVSFKVLFCLPVTQSYNGHYPTVNHDFFNSTLSILI